jgi:hypothetical protein
MEALNTVFIYDFSSDKWSHGADMPVIGISVAFLEYQGSFTLPVSGHDEDKNLLRLAAVYNVA